MPGNAGAAKGPDFWCAFEDGEVKVIGATCIGLDPAEAYLEFARRQRSCPNAAMPTTLAILMPPSTRWYRPWRST
jgi:hypothetical protein